MSTVCDVDTIGSNVTGLSYAEEVCLRELPSLAAGDLSDPVWRGLEPNSYADFGGDLTTTARQPISATRQRSKGTVTDLQASGGFNTDLTQNNLTRLLQGFFFNDAAEKPTTAPLNALQIPLTSVATSDDSYNASVGLASFYPGHIVLASNFSAANNGRKLVVSATAGKLIVSENLTDEASPLAGAKLEAVGFRFAAGEVAMTASAASMLLTIAGLTSASGTFTVTGNAADTETVVIAGKIYTFKPAPTTIANQVKIGATAQASLANLAAAINGAAGSGTLYGSGTVKHTLVTATSTATTLVVTVKNGGSSGNGLATTDTVTNGSWGAASTSGGNGSAGWLGLGVQPGEWLFLGGDDAATFFTPSSSTNRPGYARVSAVTDAVLTFDDTTFAPQTDAGTGKTLEVFFGTVLTNGAKVRSYQLERTLGVDSNGNAQAQYIKGAIANELTVNFPTAEKLNADLKFIALDDETRTGTEGLKGGVRVVAPGENAFNTSLDLYRVRMAVIDPAEMNKDALFGYVSEATITINNNATSNKALGNLGGFSVNVGNFDAGGSITAYFQTVEALRAIRANADIGMNFIVASHNAGFAFDMPLLGVGGGRLSIALNEPVKIPLDASGAGNSHGYTLLANWFAYLPNVAMPV